MLIDLTGDSSDDDNLVNNTKNNNKKSKSISSNSSPTKRPSSQSISRSGGKQVDLKKVKLASLFVPTSGTSTSSSKAKGKGKEKESFGSTTIGSTSTSSTSKVSTSSFLLPQKPSLSTASTSTSPCSNSNPSRPLEYDSRWGAGFDNSDPDAIFDTSRINYWTPTLKRVFSKHYPNDGGLRLDQVIVSKDTLREAIVFRYSSSTDRSLDFLLNHFDTDITRLLIIHNPNSDESNNTSATLGPATFSNKNCPEKKYWLLKPCMNMDIRHKGKCHSKGLILYYDNFVRVMISSGNFNTAEWNEVDDVFYIQDFPLLPVALRTTARNNPTHTINFSAPLLDFLESLGANLPYDQIQSQTRTFLERFVDYDFSASKEVRLLVSIPGSWSKKENRMHLAGGLVGLANAVQSFEFPKNGSWKFEFASSSVNPFNKAELWAKQFLACARGLNPVDFFNSTTQLPVNIRFDPIAQLKILYPTSQYIEDSISEGKGTHSLHLYENTWNESKNDVLKKCFAPSISKRPNIVSHCKILVGIRAPSPKEDNPEFVGYIYVGSHNLTQAAFGNLQTPNDPQLHIKSYELGVILPIRGNSSEELEESINRLVTYQRPVQNNSLGYEPYLKK